MMMMMLLFLLLFVVFVDDDDDDVQFGELKAGQNTLDWRRRRRRGTLLATALAELDALDSNEDDDDNNSNDDDDDEIALSVVGAVQAPNCGLTAAVVGGSESVRRLRHKVRAYGVAASGVAVVLALALAALFGAASESSATAARLSHYSVGMQSIVDWYLCTTFLMLHAMFESLPNPFALLAFVKFATIALFEMGLILLVIDARRVSGALFFFFFFFFFFFYFLLLLLEFIGSFVGAQRGGGGFATTNRREFCLVYGSFYAIAMIGLVICWCVDFDLRRARV
jgi:hypothetical protein